MVPVGTAILRPEEYERRRLKHGQLHIRQRESNLFQSSYSSGATDVKTRNLKPALPVLSAFALKRLIELHRLRARLIDGFDETGSDQHSARMRQLGDLTHRPGPSTSENGDIGAEQVLQFFKKSIEALYRFVVQCLRGPINREDQR